MGGFRRRRQGPSQPGFQSDGSHWCECPRTHAERLGTQLALFRQSGRWLEALSLDTPAQ
jgi:hypothetical protein